MKRAGQGWRWKLSHPGRVALASLLGGLPAVGLALGLLWSGDATPKVQWSLSALVLGSWLSVSIALRDQIARPLQTLSNMLAALREGDYSIRARGAKGDDALGVALLEVNALGDLLRQQRLGAREATVLLRRVMEEIDASIFAFDGEDRLRLVNPGGERLLNQPEERLLGERADDLGLADCLTGNVPRVLETSFPGGLGRWEVRRSLFRLGGLPHRLVVITDLTRALREEERLAWQRLVRVVSHEINNSLAPIQSMAGSLQSLLQRNPRPSDWESDLGQGLALIGSRSEALGRFMAAYARLARLPRPRLETLDVESWVRRVAALESRLPVEVLPAPPITILADSDQLEQLLINLVRNAADAALETQAGVTIGWSVIGRTIEVRIEDGGPGLAETANLFVPFFTTKPEGTGIGLVLSRQIAEAHGGSLDLANRPEGRGCVARLRLPLDPQATVA